MVKEPPSRRAQMRKKEEAAVVVYGAKKGDKTLAMSAKHTSAGPPKRSTLEALGGEALAPVVGELAALEKEIQRHGRQIRGSAAAEADLRQGDVRASGCPRAFCMWSRAAVSSSGFVEHFREPCLWLGELYSSLKGLVQVRGLMPEAFGAWQLSALRW